MKLQLSTLIFTLLIVENSARLRKRSAYRPHGGYEVRPRFFGGQEDKKPRPYQVVLLNPHYFLVGGGTLLSTKWVVTAAHILVQTYLPIVKLGVLDWRIIEPTQQIIKAKRQIQHEEFDPMYLHNDIGLIQLAAPAKLTQYVNPALLPPMDKNLYVGATLTASGWGALKYNRSSIVSKLRWINVKVLSNKRCTQYYTFYIDKMMCAVAIGGSINCSGDSGGPLVYYDRKKRAVLVGIMSYNNHVCGDSSLPSGYTRVSSYMQWIHSKSGARHFRNSFERHKPDLELGLWEDLDNSAS